MNEFIVIESEQDWPEINVGLVLLESKQDEISRFLYWQLIEDLIDGDFVLKPVADASAFEVTRQWV